VKKTALFLSIAVVFVLTACGSALAPAQLEWNPGMADRGFVGALDSQAESFAAPSIAPAAVSEEKAADQNAPVIQVINPKDRVVLMDASLVLVVDDPADAAEKITDMAFAKGGWVVNSNITQSVYGPQGEKYYAGEISIRVPTETADSLKSTLSEIEALAVEVKSRTMTGRDVTAEYTDAESRLKNLRSSEQRLLDIKTAATDPEVVLAVESQLRQVLGEIEVLEGQLRYFDTASQYSLITITLQPYVPSQPIDIAGWHPEGVAKEAVEDLVHSEQNLIDFLIRLGICGIPALLILAAFVIPPVLIARAVYRRYRKAHPKA